MLTGCHETTIDIKSRVLLPQAIRRAISPQQESDYASYVMIGPNGKIWIYSVPAYQELIKDVRVDTLPSKEKLDFVHLFISGSERVPWDDQNRVLLPRHMTELTKTTGKVFMIGSVTHAQIWMRETWAEHQKDLFKRSDEIVAAERRSQQLDRERRAVPA